MDRMDMMSITQHRVGVSKAVSKTTGSVAELADARALEARFWLRNEGSSPSAPIAGDLGSDALESTDAFDRKSAGKTHTTRCIRSMQRRMRLLEIWECVTTRDTATSYNTDLVVSSDTESIKVPSGLSVQNASMISHEHIPNTLLR